MGPGAVGLTQGESAFPRSYDATFGSNFSELWLSSEGGRYQRGGTGVRKGLIDVEP